MIAILVGISLLAGFILVVAIIGWEPDPAKASEAAPALPVWSMVSGEHVDRQRQAEMAAREAA